MWHDIEQNTDEWLSLRGGKVTGSSIAKIMANSGKAFGNPAKELAATLAVEQVTGQFVRGECYMNSHMERGHAEEPIARRLYEERFFVDVTNGGFYDNGFTGCSPDGVVGLDGIIEIKSAMPHIHYARVKRNGLDPHYKWQCLFNLIESDSVWLDFISYCSVFPEKKRLFVYRVDRSQWVEECQMIESRLDEFKRLVDEIKVNIQ